MTALPDPAPTPMQVRNQIRVLFLTRYPVEGASSRYRVFQYVPHLEALDVRCDVQSFMDSALYGLSTSRGGAARKIVLTAAAFAKRLHKLRRWRDYDIIYLQRELLPFGPPLIERYLKRSGAVMLFDYDDALFIKKPSRYNPIATWLRSPKKTMETMQLVDCVVAGNDWLRDSAKAFGASDAVTVEVAEDTSRIPMHPPHTNDEPVTIGWLGSPSTSKYLRFIQPVLQRISQENPNVRFEIMGGGEFEMDGVNWINTDWSLDGELDFLRRMDIGLMPLPREEWAQGKSGGKARTYMAAGVVPVCAAIGYNIELLHDGETGFLCETDDDWYRAITDMIHDAGARQRIAEAARADVEDRFLPAKQARMLRDLFDRLLQEREEARR